jgi:transposase
MALPDDLDALEADLDPAARYVVKLLRQSMEELKAMLAERDAQNARLSEQIETFQRMLFGKRSEKLPPIESEVRRVVERHELTVDGDPMPSEPEELAHERRRHARKKSAPKRKQKRALRKNLPVVTERVHVQAEDLPEGTTMADFREVGDGEVVKRVEHVREHLVVVEYQLQTLASKAGDLLVKAKAPAGVVEGGHYGPGLYAHVITSKCADSLPLHRIETMLERAGYPIARSTLCDLFHRSADLLEPIYRRILDAAKHDPYLHADETSLRVQQRGGCLSGWIWALLSSKAIAYTFDTTRRGQVAETLLADTKGFLVLDGYAGYNGVIGDHGRTRVGCWSHCRRKFFEAMKTVPEARELLDLIVELYRIEHRAAERDILGTEAHLLLREAESATIVDQINDWVDDKAGRYPPRSKMGQALTYATKQRAALRRFLDDPKLPLDNNFAERGLRIFALGRKNFLFAGHVEGAQNLAVLQSIVATCRLHGVNPYEYIKDLLIRVQHYPAREIDDLLPWNWQPPSPTSSGPAPPEAIG